MQAQDIADLEVEVGRWLGPQCRHRHWVRDGFAQGVLLDLLERMGYDHDVLPPLTIATPGVPMEIVCGSRFLDRRSGRGFTAYDVDAGGALVVAAVMALRGSRRCVTLAVA